MKNFKIYLCVLGILSASFASAKDSHSTHEQGVAPETALQELVEGNQRFVKGNAKHRNQDEERRAQLAKGQKPHSIILSCSDSRVPPELVFDQGLGELFVVRTAGNTVGSEAVASIEYAVAHLGARLILVMGHESCGAVKAALETPLGETAGSYDLDNLVGKIRPQIHASREIASASADKTLRSPVQDNVNGVRCGLIKRSKILREAFKNGDIKIQPAIYSLATGQVDLWDAKDCIK